jgi:hypothetical protein
MTKCTKVYEEAVSLVQILQEAFWAVPLPDQALQKPQ